MTTDLALPLAAVFISVALAVGSLASMALARTSPVRRRLQPTVGSGPAPAKAGLFDQLFGSLRPAKNKARQLSKTPAGHLEQGVAAAAAHGTRGLDRSRSRRLLRARRNGHADRLRPAAARADGHERVAAGSRRHRARLSHPGCRFDSRDTTPSEGDPKRVAGRHRPDCRLRRGRIEPRPGHHAHE